MTTRIKPRRMMFLSRNTMWWRLCVPLCQRVSVGEVKGEEMLHIEGYGVGAWFHDL